MMKVFLLACFLVAAVRATLVEKEFEAFKLKHNKQYSNQIEETRRFTIFRENLRSIEQHNALYKQGLTRYEKGINQFTDMTQEEFKDFLKLHSSNKPVFNATKYVKTGLAVPDSVDWRSTQVTEIKDQGDCGSCWAFSVTGSTEAAYYRKNKKLVSLSEQQLVDCTTDFNGGCAGGDINQNFPYISENGLESEEDYPYTATDGTCSYDASKIVTKVSSYVGIPSGDEDALLDAVATIGPVSVGMDASYLSAYKSGVYDDSQCSSYQLNHAVLAVGYGVENDVKYWIIKNSWATSFGEKGYFRILRGADQCGIARYMSYPVID